ncbi:MAG: hypothetical protein KF764_10000 [Labilithrix sp.]|nr:hypothetical protein [Labilithrix sp.]MBX3219845.1 hypothetical protein [Labilithrix sp.]
MASRATPALLLVLAAAPAGCDDPPRAAPVADARPSAPPPAPSREGCARTGGVDGVEGDPSCVVTSASEDAMRAALKSLSIRVTAAPLEVVGGGTALLTVTIENTSSAETTLFLEARARPAGPRTDWSRVVGVPEPRPAAPEVPRLLFPMTTTDSHDRDVDALPTVAGTGAPPPPPALLAVHLRPGGKLTRVVSWWALRIPAPAPAVTLDGGHRYVPKTTAQNLTPGEYTVTLELPFYGLGREERKVTTRLRVTRTPLPDGGLKRGF